MTIGRIGAAFAMLMLAAVPSFGATVVNDLWDPMDGSDELNLYEVYNQIYGTSFTSTNGATVGLGGAPNTVTGGMDGLDIIENGVFSGTLDGTVTFQARYAGFEQRFGYYTNPGAPMGDPTTGVSNGDYVHLFDVTDPGNTVVPGPMGVISSMDFPIGFYNNAPLAGPRTWYGEAGLNPDGGLDHMVAYRALNADGTVSTDTFIIAFEDRQFLGDGDYNDLVVEVVLPDFIPPPPDVPEPATAALLVMGLAGAALRRRMRP